MCHTKEVKQERMQGEGRRRKKRFSQYHVPHKERMQGERKERKKRRGGREFSRVFNIACATQRGEARENAENKSYNEVTNFKQLAIQFIYCLNLIQAGVQQ